MESHHHAKKKQKATEEASLHPHEDINKLQEHGALEDTMPSTINPLSHLTTDLSAEIPTNSNK